MHSRTKFRLKFDRERFTLLSKSRKVGRAQDSSPTVWITNLRSQPPAGTPSSGLCRDHQGGWNVCSTCFDASEAQYLSGIYQNARERSHSLTPKTEGLPGRNRVGRPRRNGSSWNQSLGSERKRGCL